MNFTFSEVLEKVESGMAWKQQHRQAAQEGILDSIFSRSPKTYYRTTHPSVPGAKYTESVPTLEDIQKVSTISGMSTEDEAILAGIKNYNDKVDVSMKTIYTSTKRLRTIGSEKLTLFSFQASGFKASPQEGYSNIGITHYYGPTKTVRNITTISTMTVAEAAKRIGYRFDAKKDETFERHAAFVYAIALLKKELKPLGIRVDAPKSDVQDWMDQEDDSIWLAQATFRPIGRDEETAIANMNRFIGVVGSVNEKFQALYGRKYRIVSDGDKWDVCAVLEAK